MIHELTFPYRRTGSRKGRGKGVTVRWSVPKAIYIDDNPFAFLVALAEAYRDELKAQLGQVTQRPKRVTLARRQRAGIGSQTLWNATGKLIREGLLLGKRGATVLLALSQDRSLNVGQVRRMGRVIPLMATGKTSNPVFDARITAAARAMVGNDKTKMAARK